MSVRAQVLNLLGELQAEHGLAIIFISHDLSLVRALAHRVAVMYDGRIIETGPCEEVFTDPRHPYTEALLAAIPEPDPRLYAGRERTNQVPDLDTVATQAVPTGCSYAARCGLVVDVCREVVPPLVAVGDRSAACHVNQPAEGTAVRAEGQSC
jgi:oligopeptide/dipeptide ABC transporter ATP-binding protein